MAIDSIYSGLISLTAGRILLILLAALMGLWANRRYTERLGARLLSMGKGRDDRGERERRVKTLTGFLRRAISIVILALAILALLPELGVEVAPLITAAGIGGLAIGFGAQNLVRDVISGFFILLENQIRVGDVVKINDTSGSVESLNLRTTVLRDLYGVVHVIPNGAIEKVSNMTKDWSRAVVDVGVAYKEDVDQVMDVLREIGDELAADPEFEARIVEPLNVLGVDAFQDSAVVIRMMITTKPLEQWAVGRELRRRIKNRFDELGIEIPFPHRTLYWGAQKPPVPGASADANADERSSEGPPPAEPSAPAGETGSGGPAEPAEPQIRN